jgi:hypothetical protein
MQIKGLYDPATTSFKKVIVFNNDEEAASIIGLLSYLRSNRSILEKLINKGDK